MPHKQRPLKHGSESDATSQQLYITTRQIWHGTPPRPHSLNTRINLYEPDLNTGLGVYAGGSVAAGLLITETWRYYSVQALLWGWIGIPAAAAAVGARFWPRARDLWRRYTRVSTDFLLASPFGQ